MITLFTLVDIQYVYDNGEVSDTQQVRLGELPRLIDRAYDQGRALLLHSGEFEQSDIMAVSYTHLTLPTIYSV